MSRRRTDTAKAPRRTARGLCRVMRRRSLRQGLGKGLPGGAELRRVRVVPLGEQDVELAHLKIRAGECHLAGVGGRAGRGLKRVERLPRTREILGHGILGDRGEGRAQGGGAAGEGAQEALPQEKRLGGTPLLLRGPDGGLGLGIPRVAPGEDGIGLLGGGPGDPGAGTQLVQRALDVLADSQTARHLLGVTDVHAADERPGDGLGHGLERVADGLVKGFLCGMAAPDDLALVIDHVGKRDAGGGGRTGDAEGLVDGILAPRLTEQIADGRFVARLDVRADEDATAILGDFLCELGDVRERGAAGAALPPPFLDHDHLALQVFLGERGAGEVARIVQVAHVEGEKRHGAQGRKRQNGHSHGRSSSKKGMLLFLNSWVEKKTLPGGRPATRVSRMKASYPSCHEVLWIIA